MRKAEAFPRAYYLGREQRDAGKPKVSPGGLSPVMAAWWLAGWHDRDMEVKFWP